ncbi:hypothetical protein HOE04_04135 [archaeon]|jgi:hypothetical protein|nr:hypothetical protein [archaeon]
MKIKADLHNHPSGNFKKVVETCRKNLGVGGTLGYVNYADMDLYSKFLKGRDRDIRDFGNGFYSFKDYVTILRGQEIPVICSDGKMGEIVVFGLENNLECHLSLKETLRISLENGGINYIPHPFLSDSIGEELKMDLDLLEYFDALEIYNSQAGLFDGLGFLDVNQKAQRFYELVGRDYMIGGISSTDRGGIGKSYSLIDGLDLGCMDSVKESLKESLSRHKDCFEDEQVALRGKALMHVGKVIACDNIGAKIPGVNGLLKKFELVH